MRFRSQLAQLRYKLRQTDHWSNIGIQAARILALVALVSSPGWSAVANNIPFVAPILSLNQGVQAVVYAASCIGGMAGFIAACEGDRSLHRRSQTSIR